MLGGVPVSCGLRRTGWGIGDKDLLCNNGIDPFGFVLRYRRL